MAAHADARTRGALLGVALVGLAASIGLGAFWNLRAGLGVALGATLAAGNLWVISRVSRALFLGSGARSAPWLVIALVKLFALFGAFYLLVICGFADILALAIGYGALPIGIVLSQVAVPGEDIEG